MGAGAGAGAGDVSIVVSSSSKPSRAQLTKNITAISNRNEVLIGFLPKFHYW